MEDPSFFVGFSRLWGFDFALARGISSSVTDQGTNSKEYTKVEHVNSGFASSKFPTYNPNKIIFSLYVFIFRCWSSYFFLLRRCFLLWLIASGKMKLLDVVSIMTEKKVAVLFRDTSVRNWPVFFGHSSGNYRRYFPG